MAIADFSIPYPDFQLNDVMNPEEFDLNNAAMQNKINEIRAVVNLITDSIADGGSGADQISLTAISGFTSTKLQSYLEELVSRIKSTTDNVSGADLIGSTAITGVTGTTIQAQLESLKSLLDSATIALSTHKTAATLDHPDGSVVTSKLADASVTTAKLADAGVTNQKLADSSISTAKLQDNSVTNAKIPLNAITLDKLSFSVSSSDLELSASPATSVTLSTGVQVVNSSRKSRLKIKSMPGRTLVNLLGRVGNCEDISKWSTTSSTRALDSTNFVIGSNSLKVTNSATDGYVTAGVYMNQNSRYLLVAEVKHGSGTSCEVNIGGAIATQVTAVTTKFSTLYATGVWSAVSGGTGVNLRVYGAAGSFGYFDSIRIYEITAAEKTYIDGLSFVNGQTYVSAKYPYVDDVKHVNAVYVRNTGKNLLPPIAEWDKDSSTVVTDSYSASYTNSSGTAVIVARTNVSAVVGQTYTMSGQFTSTAYLYYICFNSAGTAIQEGYGPTFTPPSGTSYVQIRVYTQATNGTYTASNLMLNIGATALTFEPQKLSYLYLPDVQLKSNADGTVADKLEMDGEGKPRVTRRFRSYSLDGSLPWLYRADYTGYKDVYLVNYPFGGVLNTQIAVKYDGKILNITTNADTGTSDSTYFDGSTLILKIADTDSGWGETYTPTAAEIQAYFYGYRMYDSNTYTATQAQAGTGNYNGTGTKNWVNIYGTAAATGGVLPTTMHASFTPYRLTYQLAQSVDEAVAYEGMLMLHDGANQIEVGTGIVVREVANVKTDSNWAVINDTSAGYVGSSLKNRTQKILSVYRGSDKDAWTIDSLNSPYGKERAITRMANYNPTAAYSVTYLALDTYTLGIAPTTINAEYAPNTKETLDDVSRALVDANTAISVLRNTKAQRQQPQSISATLLAGWTGTFNYYRDDFGIVRMHLAIQSGTTTNGTTIALMPDKYKPKIDRTFPIVNYDSGYTNVYDAFIVVTTAGEVKLYKAGTSYYVSASGITYPTDQ